MNNNTYYHLYYSYCNRTQTALSPVSDEKRFPRVWRKANSFWEEKKHVELLSDTGLIKVLYKLPVNDSVIEEVTNRPIACLIWLLDWLINLIDQSSYLLYCLIKDVLTDMTEWLSDWQTTAGLTDTTDIHALTCYMYQTALLTWLTGWLTYLLLC